ncbi:hypothetical protein H5410_010590 [Solanum commersonii]|uniref:Endonuclease/exonuclease/phosphatase domain-containing protein n=1 Tax=Solanum commersonii TaxID=4109 RepID=A0A9J6AM02_SOLCO|nr:hypothetical protein H5410_010590 [Solanum commersonii]
MDTTREHTCTNDSQSQNKLVNTAFKYTRVDRALEEKTKERTGKKAEKQGIRLNVRRNSNSSNVKIDETKEQLHEETANILEVNKEELTAMVNKRKKFSKNVMIPIEMFPENKSINITNGGLSKSKETIAIGWLSLNLQKRGSYQEEKFYIIRNEESQQILLDPDPPEDNNRPRQGRMDMIMEDTEEDKISMKSDDKLTRQHTNGKILLDEYTQPPKEITFRNNLSPRSITYPGGTYNLEKQPTSEQSQEQNNPPLLFPMLNFLSWNIRGIRSSGSIERLILFQQQLHLPLLCLQEPLVDSSKLEKFKRRLRMDHSFFIINNKIWIYWNHEIIVDIIQDKDQYVLIKISHNDGPSIFLSIIYAKCSEDLRRKLWVDLKTIANTVQGPWGAIGDFNVICTTEEKMGGRPFTLGESLDFLDCLSECGLQDAGYSGAKFTWCDNRDPPNTIWKRLDRLVYNTNWFHDYNTTSVSYLLRTCSDHAPLLVNMNNIAPQCIK